MAPRTKKPETREGKYANPRRHLLGTVEQFAAWDEAAKAAGLPWTEWARRALDLAAGREPEPWANYGRKTSP